MESLIILIPIALVLIALAVKIFFWAVDDGQFDDLEGPAHSILFDEPQRKSSPEHDIKSPPDNTNKITDTKL